MRRQHIITTIHIMNESKSPGHYVYLQMQFSRVSRQSFYKIFHRVTSEFFIWSTPFYIIYEHIWRKLRMQGMKIVDVCTHTYIWIYTSYKLVYRYIYSAKSGIEQATRLIRVKCQGRRKRAHILRMIIIYICKTRKTRKTRSCLVRFSYIFAAKEFNGEKKQIILQ